MSVFIIFLLSGSDTSSKSNNILFDRNVHHILIILFRKILVAIHLLIKIWTITFLFRCTCNCNAMINLSFNGRNYAIAFRRLFMRHKAISFKLNTWQIIYRAFKKTSTYGIFLFDISWYVHGDWTYIFNLHCV